MKLVIDVDNTIAEIHRPIILEYGLHPKTRVTDYNFFFNYGSEKKFYKVYKKIWNEKTHKIRLTDKKIPHVLNELKKKGHAIVIASNRGNGLEDTITSLKRWLQHHNIPYDYLFITNSHAVKFDLGDLLVDDNPELVGINDNKLILFDRHYNRKHDTILRIKRFKELLDLV